MKSFSSAFSFPMVSVFLFCLLLSVAPATAEPVLSGRASLPPLDREGVGYRTPRAGEGFRTEVFGREVAVLPRNRRSVAAWDLGLALYEPPPQDAEIIPFGSLYFWHHPDDLTLLRAEVAGVYNQIFLAKSPGGGVEGVLTFENYTVPVAQAELVDGEQLNSQEVLWGYVRPGFGLGFRKQMAPGFQENMLAVDLTLEPGALYFARASKTADDFVLPKDTFEMRTHLQLRWDALERNLLELPHRGFALGGDLVYGYRANWAAWGQSAEEDADGRNYVSFSGYLLAAGGVPFVPGDRHRLIGSLHGGTGSHLDRFSAPRVGGGPSPMGEEYGSTWRPVLPGAAIYEFFPDHYALAVGEYRWEPIFFTYLSLRASVAYLDRLRLEKEGTKKESDFFSSLGTRITSGFFFETRLQIDYNYNTSVVRDGSYGGSEIVVHLSRNF